MNFIDHNDLKDPVNSLDLSNGVDITHLDVSDFSKDDGKIDNLIGDGNVHTNLIFFLYYHIIISIFILICFIYI